MTNIEKNICYTFKDIRLLHDALHHSSIKKNAQSFERLEFLGDRVLGVVIAEYLYKNVDGLEGVLAKEQAKLVCCRMCAQVAKDIELDKELSVADKHLKTNISVLGDAMEAVIGAIFLDTCFSKTREIILKLWNNHIKEYDEQVQDPKTTLQELCQKRAGITPIYQVVSVTGSAHEPKYTILLEVLDKKAITCKHTKKEAEIKAATEILKELL